MKVVWKSRALHQHRRLTQLGRMKARLTTGQIGEISLGVPVIAERHLVALSKLRDDFEALAARVAQQLEEMQSAMGLLRGDHHPEGWADVHVIERRDDLLIVQVRHHQNTSQKHDQKALMRHVRRERRKERNRERALVTQLRRRWKR